jgi:hypothetical protein
VQLTSCGFLLIQALLGFSGAEPKQRSLEEGAAPCYHGSINKQGG